VLFADLVGFTALAEHRDSEAVRELLSLYFDECRTIIGRYGGTIEKFIGDAVMAVWGVPTAHEDDAERAVRAGLELVGAISRFGEGHGLPGLSLRVGVVTGEVAATIGATGQSMVAGDAVNTASRIQSQASPGEVWVDEQTRALTSAAIRYDDKGLHPLKGRSQEVRLFSAAAVVSGVGGQGLPDYLTVPLVGYHRELALVKELLHASMEESRARLLIIRGDAGVGKSRLTTELEHYIDGLSAGIWWLSGRCLSYGDGVAFSALVSVLRARIEANENDDGDVLRAKLDGSLARLVPDDEERSWLAPRLMVLLGQQNPGLAREDLYGAWMFWLERLGGPAGPVVWVIDDAHLADDALLAFVEHVVRSATTPIFILVLARPELQERFPAFGSGRRATSVHLEGLTDSAMETLFGALVQDLTSDVRRALVEQAAGLPLYAIERVRSMADLGLVIHSGGQRRLAPGVSDDQLVDAVAPMSVQLVVASRLDLLPERDRALLQDAAVLGQSFRPAGLAVVSGLEADVVLESLARLEQRDLVSKVVDRLLADFDQYTFVQSVVRQVAYQQMSRRERAERHLRAADYLAGLPEASGELTAVVAQHLGDACEMLAPDDPRRSELIRRRSQWLERAGTRAESMGALVLAQRSFEQALEGVDEPADQDRLHVLAGEVAHRAGRYDEAIEHAVAVAGAGPAAGVVYEAAALLASSWRGRGDFQQARDALHEFSSVKDLDRLPTRTAVRIAMDWSRIEIDRSDHDEAFSWAEAAVNVAERSQEPQVLADAFNNLSYIFVTRGSHAVAGTILAKAVEIARAHHLSTSLAMGLSNQACDDFNNDLPAAISKLQEARQIARQVATVLVDSVTSSCLAAALRVVGRWDEVLALAAEIELDWASMTEVQSRSWLAVRSHVALVQLSRGGSAVPVGQVVDPAELSLVAGSMRPSSLLFAGLCDRANGGLASAADHAAQAARAAFDLGADDDELPTLWPIAGDWAIEAGDLDLARHLVRWVEEDAGRQGGPLLRAQLLRVRGAVEAAEHRSMAGPEQIESDLRDGIDALEELGAMPDRAKAQAVLGAWLRSQGRGEEAEPLVTQAFETFEALGAQAWTASLNWSLGHSIGTYQQPMFV
jgi:class 3 adenylate cyclase/tetratricopeptide (TPR) repeat protein